MLYDQWDDLTKAEWNLVVHGQGCFGRREGKVCGAPAPYPDTAVGGFVCADHWTGPRCQRCDAPVLADGQEVCETCAVVRPD